MNLQCILTTAVAISLNAGIGTDYVDDLIVDPRIEATIRTVGLIPGEKHLASADYYNMYGVLVSVPFTWTSTNPSVAEVDETGLVTALMIGQTEIQPHFGGLSGPVIIVSVQTDPNGVAFVEIASPSDELIKGEKLQVRF